MLDQISRLKKAITENLRVQAGGAEMVSYIDTTDALPQVSSRQNHVIFARRGCGKTLLLHTSEKMLPAKRITVYLNCEDYKNHSFPNILIEILDQIFSEIESKISGIPWGKHRKARNIIAGVREELGKLRTAPDERHTSIKETTQHSNSDSSNLKTGLSAHGASLVSLDVGSETAAKAEIEKQYEVNDSKIEKLNLMLPRLKKAMNDFFSVYTGKVDNIFLQIDDFYHIQREIQPYVIDYIHRFCKDIPVFFKLATLKHASTLYLERKGQPIGVQERHDYQPIDIDFTFQDFQKTEGQVKEIFYKFGELAEMTHDQIDKLFKGDGFRRLILAGGGVPRDCLSLFLEALENAKRNADGRISKDEIRNLSFSTIERRIQELKNDSQDDEQNPLIRGIYAIRKFCTDSKHNIFVVAERLLQENERVQRLIYKLLEYRIIHSVGSAFTNKSRSGTFDAFMIDVGCYANFRKLYGKMEEIDLSEKSSKEKIRSEPVLSEETLLAAWSDAPEDAEKEMLDEEKGAMGAVQS